MIILGIDPGSRSLGYGVIEVQGRKIQYIGSGTFQYSNEKYFLNRLCQIHRDGQKLIEEFTPSHISLESLIYVKSVTSLAKLAQARGAMLGSFGEEYKDLMFEYSPNLIKSSVSGFGHASKDGISKAVGLILGVKNFKKDDESDALAVALCHAFTYPNSRRLSSKSLRN